MYRTSTSAPAAEGRPVRTFLGGVLLLAGLSTLLGPFLHPFEPIKPYDPPSLVTLDVYPSSGALWVGLVPLVLSIAWGAFSLRRPRHPPAGTLVVPVLTALSFAAWLAWVGQKVRGAADVPPTERGDFWWLVEDAMRVQSAGALVLSAILCVTCVLHAVRALAGRPASAAPPRVRRRTMVGVVLGLALVHAAVLLFPGARLADLRSLTLVVEVVAVTAMLHAWNAASKGVIGEEYRALAHVGTIAVCGAAAVYLAGLSEYVPHGVAPPVSYQVGRVMGTVASMSRANDALLRAQRGSLFLLAVAIAIALSERGLLSKVRWKDHLDALARQRARLRENLRAHARSALAFAALLAAVVGLPTASLARLWNHYIETTCDIGGTFLPSDLSLPRQSLQDDVSWPTAPLIGIGRSLLTIDGRELGPVSLLDTETGRASVHDSIVAATRERVWPYHSGPPNPSIRHLVVAADRSQTVQSLRHLAAVLGEPSVTLHLVHALDRPLPEPWPLDPGRLANFHPAITLTTLKDATSPSWNDSHFVIEEAGVLSVRLPDQTWTTLAAVRLPPSPPLPVTAILVPDAQDTIQQLLDTARAAEDALHVSYVWLADPETRRRLRP